MDAKRTDEDQTERQLKCNKPIFDKEIPHYPNSKIFVTRYRPVLSGLMVVWRRIFFGTIKPSRWWQEYQNGEGNIVKYQNGGGNIVKANGAISFTVNKQTAPPCSRMVGAALGM